MVLSEMIKYIKTLVIANAARLGFLLRILLLPYRATIALQSVLGPVKKIFPWLFGSREYTSWTYHLTEDNIAEICNIAAMSTRCSIGEVLAFKDEFFHDAWLADYVKEQTLKSAYKAYSDPELKVGRRFLLYILVRIKKPKIIVEAGVDKGLGSVVMCRALQKNRKEGYSGRYFGVDVHAPQRAFLFSEAFEAEGVIVQSDSVEFLKAHAESIDFFLHETHSSPDHLQNTFDALWPKLSPLGCFCAPWVTSQLIDLLQPTAQYFTFRENPKNHWFSGSRVTIAVKRA